MPSFVRVHIVTRGTMAYKRYNTNRLKVMGISENSTLGRCLGAHVGGCGTNVRSVSGEISSYQCKTESVVGSPRTDRTSRSRADRRPPSSAAMRTAQCTSNPPHAAEKRRSRRARAASGLSTVGELRARGSVLWLVFAPLFDPVLVLLDPGLEQCVANCKARPWEPHKYASEEEQGAKLPFLLSWVSEYYTRDGDMSRAGHEALFRGYPGAKHRIRQLPDEGLSFLEEE